MRRIATKISLLILLLALPAAAQQQINWATQIRNFPAACGAGTFAVQIGVTITCQQGFYQTVQDASGTPVTQAPVVKFAGTAVTSVNTAAGVTTVTLTAGAGGTGCSPSGTTPTAILYDTGSGNCDDVPKITWNNGTSTLLGASGGHFDFTAFTDFKFKFGTGSSITNTGASGQVLISNADGTGTFVDPLVSGFTAHDAVGTSTNPVLLGGYAYATLPTAVSTDGDAVRAWFLPSGQQAVTLMSYAGVDVEVANLAGGNAMYTAVVDTAGAQVVPLSDTALRATPVPVSGTVTVTDGAGALNVIVDSGTLTTVSTVTNLSQLGGTAISMNTGVRDAGTQRVTIATNDLVPISAASLPLPTGASTLAEQQTQTTSLQLLDDIVNAANSALGKVAAIGCQFDDTTPGTVTENNVSPVRCSTRREVYGQIRDAAGNERGLNVDANGEIGVGAIRTSVTPGTAAANLGKAEDAAHSSADVGVMALTVRDDYPPAATASATGEYQPALTDEAGATYVRNGGSGSGATAPWTSGLQCDTPILYSAATNGKTTLIALTSAQTIRVCGISIAQSTTTAVTVSIGSGTGTDCVTTYTAKSPAYVLQAATSTGPIGIVLNMSQIPWFTTASGENLCVQTNAAVSVQIVGMAAKF